MEISEITLEECFTMCRCWIYFTSAIILDDSFSKGKSLICVYESSSKCIAMAVFFK